MVIQSQPTNPKQKAPAVAEHQPGLAVPIYKQSRNAERINSMDSISHFTLTSNQEKQMAQLAKLNEVIYVHTLRKVNHALRFNSPTRARRAIGDGLRRVWDLLHPPQKQPKPKAWYLLGDPINKAGLFRHRNFNGRRRS